LGLASLDSQMRDQKQNQVYSARQDEANDKLRVWDWNERQDYIEKANAKAALKGAGMQNLTNAPNQAMSGLVQADYMKFLQGAYGGGSPQGSTLGGGSSGGQQSPSQYFNGQNPYLQNGMNGGYLGGYPNYFKPR